MRRSADNPTAGQKHKALGGVGALDDLQSPSAVGFERGFEFVAGIATVGKHMAQEREAEADGFEDIDSAVAVLNVGGMDEDEHQKAADG